MIIINIQGGLGNQLFQYAFAFAFAKRIRTPCFLDYTNPFIVPTYFKVNKFYIWMNKNKYLYKLNKRICMRLKSMHYIDYRDCALSADLLLRKNDTYYDGYFQSIAYFEQNETDIKKLFSIRKIFKRRFDEKYKTLFAQHKTIVLHVRRTDYLVFGEVLNLGSIDLSLPLEYYMSAFSTIEHFNEYQLIVIGDDINFAKEHFSSYPNTIFSQNEMIVDFQLMMNADIAIISNSTFSWWAAYLNPKKQKRVLAPKDFLGFHLQEEFPNGISKSVPFEWISVN